MNESLYQLSKELAPLEAILEESGGVVEGQELLVDRVTALLDKTQAKVDAYGMFYKSLEAVSKAIKDEENRLAERRGAIENKLKRLKDAAKVSMEARGIVKMEGEKFTISVQPNGGVPQVELLVEDPEKLPPKFTKMSTVTDVDAIRKGLINKDPDAEAVAKFNKVGTHVRIR